MEENPYLQNAICTHPRADMPCVPHSLLGYARKCMPSLLNRQARQPNSVRKVGLL